MADVEWIVGTRTRYLTTMVNQVVWKFVVAAVGGLYVEVTAPGSSVMVSAVIDMAGPSAAIEVLTDTTWDEGTSLETYRVECIGIPVTVSPTLSHLMAQAPGKPSQLANVYLANNYYGAVEVAMAAFEEICGVVLLFLEEVCVPDDIKLFAHSFKLDAGVIVMRAFISTEESDGGSVLPIATSTAWHETEWLTEAPTFFEMEGPMSDPMFSFAGLQELTAAVKRLADRNMEFRINDSGPIFSVTSGDVTE